MRPPALLLPLLLLGGCARTLFGRGEPYQPWASPAVGVTAEQRGDALVLHPPPELGTPRVLLFLHGFASSPAQYRFTLEQLSARGFLVLAPTLPDYVLFRVGYELAVLEAAQAAYDDAAREAEALHGPAPVVVGYSMGGGAALLVGAYRGRPTVVWAPAPLDLTLPGPTAPLLVLIADHDCVVRERPVELVRLLGSRAESAVIPGNHLGFTDLSGGEQFDCPSPVSRDAQRADAVARTAAFLGAALP
jgi:hypothetical protein